MTFPRLSVGDRVRYKQWPGFVREVLSNGTVLIDWNGAWPVPFFNGPYRPAELEIIE